MKTIIKVHHPKVKEKLVKEALEIFFDVRKVPGLKKKPSTSELVDWLKLLMAGRSCQMKFLKIEILQKQYLLSMEL
jgi:MoxR-like ATPase